MENGIKTLIRNLGLDITQAGAMSSFQAAKEHDHDSWVKVNDEVVVIHLMMIMMKILLL